MTTTDETNAVLSKPLKRIRSCDLYWIDDAGVKQYGHHANLWSHRSNLWGDCSGLTGDCSKIPFHVRPCNLSDWIEE